MPLIRELIHVPEELFKGDFVLNLSDGVTRPQETVASYVVTPQLTTCFRDALKFIKSAVDSRSSKAAYLHGSFGAGKSHFMAILYLLLHHDPAARTHADLAPICEESAWADGRKFLLVPYHMIGATSLDSAVLDGYVKYVSERHPEAPVPPVYKAEALFEQARDYRQRVGDTTFFADLNASNGGSAWGKLAQGWSAESFGRAVAAPPRNAERLRLVSDLVDRIFRSYKTVFDSNTKEAHVNLDDGLSIISQHAKSLGYDALILFLDELILWLASHAADLDFVHHEGQKLAKLIEATSADRPTPVVSFVARQRDLRELVGEHVTGAEQLGFSDALKHWEGRFHTIALEDRNLPVIAQKRILRPLSDDAERQMNDAFAQTAKVRQEVMNVLLTSQATPQTFRQVYPFSPALIENLVAVSSVLQRERTALRVMLELLVRQRDTLELGQVIPVGDLFDVVAHGEEAFSPGMQSSFDNAKRLYHEKLRPMLEEQHGIVPDRDLKLAATDPELGPQPERSERGTSRKAGDKVEVRSAPPPLTEVARRLHAFRNDDRLVKTLLLSALVPEVESLKSLTALRLAALNHGTIKSPIPNQEAQIVLRRVREWASRVGEIRLSSDEANPVISVQLSGIDTEAILEKAAADDNIGNRRRFVRQLLFEDMGIVDRDELVWTHEVIWRGTRRSVQILYTNVRELPDQALQSDENWKLIIGWPFDDGHSPADGNARLENFETDNPGTPARTLVWLPSFLSASAQRDLGTLVRLEHVLASTDRFESVSSHLAMHDRVTARTLLDNQRSALRSRFKTCLLAAYGLDAPQGDAIDNGCALSGSDHFRSLYPGFSPRPPATSSFKPALSGLLDQALSFQFPGHPRFDVDAEIRIARLKTVWQEVQRAVQSPDGRVFVEEKNRALVRQIANPLRLGTMHETHFLLEHHWRGHFNRKIAEHKLTRVTVNDLYAWMDDPQPTGLPDAIRNLIVCIFADQENRTFHLQGQTVVPELDQLRPDMELVLQQLPPQEQWDAAVDRANRLLEVERPPLLTGASLARFAGQVRSAAPSLDENAAVPREIEKIMERVGMNAREEAPRLRTARAAVELSAAVAHGKDELDLIRRLAAVPIPTTDVAVRHSLKKAAAVVEAIRNAKGELFEALATLSDERREAGARILADLHRALAEDEFGIALEPALRDAERKAVKLLAGPVKPPPTTPPPPAPPHPPNRQVIRTNQVTAADATQARRLLTEIEEAMTDGRRIDLTYTIWDN